MEYIQITEENLEKEHICCAISNNKDVQVSSKKEWLKDRLKEGLVFLKSTERGKCFIEYIPAEYAWVPISADRYMYIDCLWVSGSFKGHGYSSDLLNACIEDSKQKGKAGLCILAAAKKKPFLATRSILPIRDLPYAMRQTTAFSSGFCHLKRETKCRSSGTAQSIRIQRRRAMSSTTPASARSMQSMCRSCRRLPQRQVSRFRRFISIPCRLRRMRRHRSQPMRCFMTGNTLPMNR